MEKIHKTLKECVVDINAILKQKKIAVILLKKHYAELDEIRKLTQLEDAITRSMKDIRRVMIVEMKCPNCNSTAKLMLTTVNYYHYVCDSCHKVFSVKRRKK